MPGKRSWLALGCGAYLAFVCMQFQAATAYRWFAPDALRLAGISGTIWSGRAQLASLSGLPMRDLEWDLAALPLLLGRLSIAFSVGLPDGSIIGSANATMRALTLADMRASASLDTLGIWVPLRGVRGLVNVNLDEFKLRDGWPISIVGVLRLRQLEVPPLIPGAAAAPVALGDFELSNVEISNRRISARLRDTGGPLEVEGTVALALQADSTIQGAVPMFDVLVRERAGISTALREPLEFLTVDVDESGWRTLDLDPWLSTL